MISKVKCKRLMIKLMLKPTKTEYQKINIIRIINFRSSILVRPFLDQNVNNAKKA